MVLRDIIIVIWLIVCVVLTLRDPFFGAVAILVHFVLKEVLIVETYEFFLQLHFFAVLNIATLAGVLLTRSDRLGEFWPSGLVDWGIIGFFGALLLSSAVNSVEVIGHKYIDLYFKAMVLYFLLSRLTDTPRRVMITALALVAATSYLMFLAWSKVHMGYLVYARPYWFSSHHDFGLQLVITLPLIGALVSGHFATTERVAAVLLLLLFGFFTRECLWLEATRPALVGVGITLMLAAALMLGQAALGARVALFVLLPFFVLVSLRCMSRSAYLGAGLGLAMLMWYYRRKTRVIILSIPFIAFAIYHQTERVQARLESIWTQRLATGEEDVSIDMRKEQFRTAMRILSAHPVLGIGPRQFLLRYYEWVSPEDFRNWSYTMHCVPLLILTEEGMIGFAIFYGLIALGALRDARRAAIRARGEPELEDVAIVGAGAFMGFLAWMGFSIGQPAMWTINIYGTVALVEAVRRVTEAHFLAVEERAAEEAEAQGLVFEPATTEVLFS